MNKNYESARSISAVNVVTVGRVVLYCCWVNVGLLSLFTICLGAVSVVAIDRVVLYYRWVNVVYYRCSRFVFTALMRHSLVVVLIHVMFVSPCMQGGSHCFI